MQIVQGMDKYGRAWTSECTARVADLASRARSLPRARAIARSFGRVADVVAWSLDAHPGDCQQAA